MATNYSKTLGLPVASGGKTEKKTNVSNTISVLVLRDLIFEDDQLPKGES
jgi:hypothetical protein